ncbi:MAG TPA: ATP synthase F1 subunit gamma [Candidatus Acidoferrales bacterium]|nr:ATP synthase F1 subunit gamma [Candidatus Acidoferrales bacterium]
MATLLDFRRRIRSVKNTQQITRAMKFIAAARLRKAQEGVVSARPYAREILRILRSAVARMENPLHPLLERREEKSILVIVLTGDRGLAGAFNANVLRYAQNFLRDHAAQKIRVIAVGKKGRDVLRKKNYELVGEFLNISLNVEFRNAKEISVRVVELYEAKEVDAVYAIYNEFKSVIVQRLCSQKLLPIEPEVLKSDEAAGAPNLVDYIYEQPPAEIFKHMVPRYIDTEIFRILLESAAAEHGARMAAMDSATNNAGELITELTLEMNKIRQAGITRELIEIVSGASTAG